MSPHFRGIHQTFLRESTVLPRAVHAMKMSAARVRRELSDG
jgi:hypothetical protein